MLIDGEERHARARGVFFGELCSGGTRSFIDFRNEDERAVGLEDSEDFADITGQVRPPEMCFHGSDEIEHVIRKRRLSREGFRRGPELYIA
jgi:hypothetical protein